MKDEKSGHVIFSSFILLEVGMAGFEPTLSCTPCRRIRPGFPTSRKLTNVQVIEAFKVLSYPSESCRERRGQELHLHRQVWKTDALLCLYAPKVGHDRQSTWWELNPHILHGKQVGYHYITGAEEIQSTQWDLNPHRVGGNHTCCHYTMSALVRSLERKVES